MHPVSEVINYVLAHESLLYPLLTLIVMIQAEVGMLVSLYPIRLGQADWPIFVTLTLAGVIIGEFGIFFAGAYIGKTRFGEKLLKKIPWNEKIHVFLHGNTYTSLLAAKSMWVSRLVVFWMGHSGMKFSKFAKAETPAILIWFIVLASIIYGLISILGIADEEAILRRVEIVLPIVFFIMIIIQLALRVFMRKIFRPKVHDTKKDH